MEEKTTASKLEDLYSVSDVADRYGVKERTVLEWVQDGRIACIDVGRYLFTTTHLLEYEKSREVRRARK